jgi:hypothetical protein
LERRLRKAVIMKLNEQDENIEQILESAVVVNWADLIRGGQSGLIHIEYGGGESAWAKSRARVQTPFLDARSNRNPGPASRTANQTSGEQEFFNCSD